MSYTSLSFFYSLFTEKKKLFVYTSTCKEIELGALSCETNKPKNISLGIHF